MQGADIKIDYPVCPYIKCRPSLKETSQHQRVKCKLIVERPIFIKLKSILKEISTCLTDQR